MNRRAEAELRADVQKTQIRPVAGIWSCPNCERHIQVIMDSTVPEKGPFICVCGTQMEPGEAHAEVEVKA